MDVCKTINIDQETIDRWNIGIKNYPKFWLKSWYKLYEEKYLEKTPLRSYFKDMIGDKKEIKIADVGSGALVQIGHYWDGVDVKIYPMDLSAKRYNDYYKKLGITPIILVENQNIENIGYPDNTFDIVHCSNTLDHCCNPIKGIYELIRICKIGGWIYLRHFNKSAFNQRFKTIHVWNIKFIPKLNDAIFYSGNKKTKFMLNDLTEKMKSHFKSFYGVDWEGCTRAMIISKMRKWN